VDIMTDLILFAITTAWVVSCCLIAFFLE